MGKIKDWFKNNAGWIFTIFTAIAGVLLVFVGYRKGSQEKQSELNEKEINIIKKEAQIKIEKEKIADEKKTITEISKDVDDMLDS